jgi:hypothetical protein
VAVRNFRLALLFHLFSALWTVHNCLPNSIALRRKTYVPQFTLSSSISVRTRPGWSPPWSFPESCRFLQRAARRPTRARQSMVRARAEHAIVTGPRWAAGISDAFT